MSIASVSALSAGGVSPALLASARAAEGGRPTASPSRDDVQRAAKQFEAILVRQLLAPAVEPMMNGSLGGASGPGGGVYGYMLTDVLANAVSQGGGLGLAGMLQTQLSPRGDASPAPETHE